MTTKRDIQHTPAHQALKRDTRTLVSAAGGGKEAAEFTRVNPSVLSDYQSPNTDAFIPADVIADLEAVTRGTKGWPILTRRLASMAGCSLVVLPDAGHMAVSWVEEIGHLVAHHGELASRLCAAASDGAVSPREIKAADLIQLCDDAVLDLVNLRARFERIVEEGIAG